MKHLPILLLWLPVCLTAQSKSPVSKPDTITEHWYAADKKEPTAKEVLLKVTVYNLARNKVAGVDVRVVQTETSRVWTGPTGSYGEIYFLVPKGKEYRVDAGDETGIQTLRVSDDRFARESLGITYLPSRFTEEERNDTIFQKVSPAQTPTRSRVLVQLTILDLDNRPLEDEEMYFAAQKAGKVYTGKTNRGGKAFLVLPLGDNYCISTRFEADLKCYDMPQDDRAGQLNITYNTIGTKAILQRKAERERRAAIADSLYRLERTRDSLDLIRYDSLARVMRVRDSIDQIRRRAEHVRDSIARIREDSLNRAKLLHDAAALARYDSLRREERLRDSIATARMTITERRRKNREEDFVHQLLFGEAGPEVQKRIRRRAAEERDSLKRNSRYFEQSGEVVKATLYRMRERWKHKVIVTDLTGSMSPYMDQVVLWHALQLVQGEDNRYLFFNDGDRKADTAKVIGQTGGIYFAEKGGLDTLLAAMKKTAQMGYGGDTPENDLEALLAGVKKMRGLDELILVADNQSDMRDFKLLPQLKVPVHVILCGTEFGVNEEYLELAYQTRGSVHTIEQDIEDLAKLADGATLTIGRFQYRVSRGKFIQVSRI